ncbi:type I methionyl aminopeptidase [Yersinia frederiksenii]|uniref:type I methionyl aminopeptidase n=1 Tax=Yersinia frederiksenii TaxID=29484 RepID=UPI0011AA47F8|nr:type I methionyl aminopeptidase [Yersinia frederiksenii]
MISVKIHSAAEIEMARAAGQAAAKVLEMITPYVQAGITTDEIDRLCHDYIVNVLKVIPANIGYHGYTRTICTSVNHVVCHGIPSDKKLKNGDIVNIDVAIIKDGWYGDTSRMYFVGEPSVRAKRLVDITYLSMVAGIKVVRPGATLGDIGAAIQHVAESAGFSVVREYCGHGVGQEYHTDPQILHYGTPGVGMNLKAGMIFTIEPMINAGKAATSVLSDGWTVVTKDRSLSAQWEHTIAVTESGYDLLTPWPEGTGEYAPI